MTFPALPVLTPPVCVCCRSALTPDCPPTLLCLTLTHLTPRLWCQLLQEAFSESPHPHPTVPWLRPVTCPSLACLASERWALGKTAPFSVASPRPSAPELLHAGLCGSSLSIPSLNNYLLSIAVCWGRRSKKKVSLFSWRLQSSWDETDKQVNELGNF